MSRIDIAAQANLLKEAGVYYKDVKPVRDEKEGAIVLTKEHIMEWLEVFYDDRIRMDTCNEASVKMYIALKDKQTKM